MADIKHLLTIKAPVEKVYKAITEQQGLASWWTTETVAKPEVKSIAEFRFGDRYHDKMLITNLESNRKVEWECVQGDKEWLGTEFSFHLEQEEDHTILRFTHKNWTAETDFYASCNYIWGGYMTSLKQYCETGNGAPFTASSTK